MSGLSFLPENRLTKRQDYLSCYSKGKKIFTKSFVVFIAKREDESLPWRLGMAVTRKTGPAVQRNRLRRMIRESFRLGQKNIPQGYDFVVVPKRQLRVPGLLFASLSCELDFVIAEFERKLFS